MKVICGTHDVGVLLLLFPRVSVFGGDRMGHSSQLHRTGNRENVLSHVSFLQREGRVCIVFNRWEESWGGWGRVLGSSWSVFYLCLSTSRPPPPSSSNSSRMSAKMTEHTPLPFTHSLSSYQPELSTISLSARDRGFISQSLSQTSAFNILLYEENLFYIESFVCPALIRLSC